MKTQYNYFVSYSHSTGLGCIEIFMDKEINSFDDIEELCKNTIPNKNGLKEITVINFQLLSRKLV